MSDQIVYAPTDVPGPLPSIVALTAALSALIQAAGEHTLATEEYGESFRRAYDYLTTPEMAPEMMGEMVEELAEEVE
jgi:hypothetical protein